MCLKLFHPNLNSKRDAPSSSTPERPFCTLSCYICLVLYLSDLSDLITVEISASNYRTVDNIVYRFSFLY